MPLQFASDSLYIYIFHTLHEICWTTCQNMACFDNKILIRHPCDILFQAKTFMLYWALQKEAMQEIMKKGAEAMFQAAMQPIHKVYILCNYALALIGTDI